MEPLKLLFVCRHNRCRSVFAESIANHLAEGRIEARSVGTKPSGELHAPTLDYLAGKGYPTEGLQSRAWDALEDYQPELVITLCDDCATEPLPSDGRASRLHWGLRDPCVLNGDFALQEATFGAIAATLERRLKLLLQVHRNARPGLAPSLGVFP
jgi:arsenate reductase